MGVENTILEKLHNEPKVDLDLFKLLLQTGRSILDLQIGIVSKVYGSNYELIQIDGFAGEYEIGDILQIKSTYCRDVIDKEKTIALTEMQGVRGLQKHPLYKTNTLEAYIGVPIFFKEKVWGTINFSSAECRLKDFSRAEVSLVESYASLISESLSN